MRNNCLHAHVQSVLVGAGTHINCQNASRIVSGGTLITMSGGTNDRAKD